MTHNERVLRLLSDGKPHSHHELYDLHVIAHSRVSDLRKRGHVIEAWREGDLYLYQLSTDEPSNGTSRPGNGWPSAEGPGAPLPAVAVAGTDGMQPVASFVEKGETAPSVSPDQLVLEAA